MNRLAVIAKRYSYAATAVLLAGAMMLPVLLSSQVSAAQVESRSLKLSDSTKSAAASYELQFNATSDTQAEGLQAIVIDFCDSPIHETACVAPGGTFAPGSSVTVATSGTPFAGTWSVATAAAEPTAITVESTSVESVTADDTITVTLPGFTNPTAVGTVYARVYTFDTTTLADAYVTETPGAYVDYGAVAFSITESIDVTAIVRETLTFCVSGDDAIATTGCGAATVPAVNLGDEVDTGIFVIDASAVYTADIFYRLSTNAANGTNINIKGSNLNLVSGSNSINSNTSPTTTLAAGTAGFGINVADPGLSPEEGTPLVADSNVATVAGNYSVPAATTGTYGAPIATASGPVLNADGTLRFGATAAANTPAGVYKASYNLIATPSY